MKNCNNCAVPDILPTLRTDTVNKEEPINTPAIQREMTLTAIIIDSNKEFRQSIRSYITSSYPSFTIVAEAVSACDGAILIQRYNPHLVLLDTTLPDGSAFEMLEQLPYKNFEIIFTASDNTCAVKAIKLAAADYLLKPVVHTELKEALKKAETRTKEKHQFHELRLIFHNLNRRTDGDKRLAIATTGGYLFADLQSIIRLEAHANYTHIHFKEKKKIISSGHWVFMKMYCPAKNFSGYIMHIL